LETRIAQSDESIYSQKQPAEIKEFHVAPKVIQKWTPYPSMVYRISKEPQELASLRLS